MDFTEIYTPEVMDAARMETDCLHEQIIAEREIEDKARREHWPLVWIKGIGPVPIPPSTETAEKTHKETAL